jgi:hypothetical protein
MSEHVFPWIYAYTEDPTVGAKERLHRMGRLPLRPILTGRWSGLLDVRRLSGWSIRALNTRSPDRGLLVRQGAILARKILSWRSGSAVAIGS